MNTPTAEQLQTWLDDPVTRWIKATLQKERDDLDFKLKNIRFDNLKDVTEVQVTLNLVDRWTTEPERRLQKLIIKSNAAEDDPYS